jgi:hypothetical protein
MATRGSIHERVARLDWVALEQSLDGRGYATTPPLLGAAECAELTRLYDDAARFRSRIDMARFRFGEGEYKYFAHPLPASVAALRTALYPRLVPTANRWMGALGLPDRFPPALDTFLAHCAARGQRRPTPLLLRYTAGGYNCLHQDLYGAVAFPLQLTIALGRRDVDYRGGEFLLVEQRPRAQSRGEAIVLERGAAVIFATRHRPVHGTRGWYRATMRHGVSRITAGERTTLGVIFHDAE